MTRDQFIYALTACGCLLKDGKTWYEHNELIKCFEDLGLFEQEPQTFKWCTDCKEYDQEKHCCHRWSKVIRDTVEEMKQESVIDKIRAEIEQRPYGIANDSVIQGMKYERKAILEIIDKYKKESEEQGMSEEEIRVGDEVLSDIGISSSKGLVLGFCNRGIIILWQDLRCTTWDYEGAKSIKTGRNFPQIAEVLKQMKEPQESEE